MHQLVNFVFKRQNLEIINKFTPNSTEKSYYTNTHAPFHSWNIVWISFFKIIQLKGQHSNYLMSQTRKNKEYLSENRHLPHFGQLTWSDKVVPYKNTRDLAIDTKFFSAAQAIARLFWGFPLQTFLFLDLINLLIPKYCFMQNTLLTDKFTKKSLPEKNLNSSKADIVGSHHTGPGTLVLGCRASKRNAHVSDDSTILDAENETNKQVRIKKHCPFKQREKQHGEHSSQNSIF